MRNAIITLVLFVLGFTAVAAQDTLSYTVFFHCNSSELSYEQSEELDFLVTTEIISIDAYASVDGNASANQELSEARGHAVSSLLDFTYVAHGATTKFGSRAANRVVVITYVIATDTTPAVVPTTFVFPTAPDAEGFTCGNTIDPTSYWADTLQVDSTVETVVAELPAPIVLTNVSPSLTSSDSLVSVVSSDTTFLPIADAVRFYQQKGYSAREARSIVEGRKQLWKQLKETPKAVKAPKKAKSRKVKMRRTRGANRTLLVRLFPFAGC